MENKTFYNEVLIEHNQHPIHKEKLPDANLVLEGVNPSCGDDIILQLKGALALVTVSTGTADGNHFAALAVENLVDGIQYVLQCIYIPAGMAT